MEKKIYSDLNDLLKKILEWLKFNTKEDFDLDEDFISLLNKYDIDSSYGMLGHIYSFLDVVCDSKRHLFKEVAQGYSYNDALNDLTYIIHLIDSEEIEKLEKDDALKERFKSI